MKFTELVYRKQCLYTISEHLHVTNYLWSSWLQSSMCIMTEWVTAGLYSYRVPSYIAMTTRVQLLNNLVSQLYNYMLTFDDHCE